MNMRLTRFKLISFLIVIAVISGGCSHIEEATDININTDNVATESNDTDTTIENDKSDDTDSNEEDNSNTSDSNSFDESGYTVVSADSCSLSGGRVANAKVDIGYDSDYANREYWAYTNDFGQLVHVEADEIIIQNDDQEIPGEDRYCSDEAKVPGVEQSDLDEGHVIADSLGGASNAYNITPQESNLNRHGMQADIEEEIREAGGATNFSAEIEYPDTETQIPSSYTLTYTINGTEESHTYANEYIADEDEESVGNSSNTTAGTNDSSSINSNDVYYANCTAVREAGAAPIHSGDPGYSSKLDRDGDGTGCE